MKNEAPELIKKLGKFDVSLIDIAAKFHVSYSTVYLWAKGGRNPSYLTIEKLKQTLRGCQNRKSQK